MERPFRTSRQTSGAIFTERWAGRGLAIGDINNDGRVDAVITTNGGEAHLIQNETTSGNHWLLLEPGGPQEQPRWNRSGGQCHDIERNAVRHGHDGQQLSLIERQARAFWPGTRLSGETH